MKPIIGATIGGAVFAGAAHRFGAPFWGPAAMLRDLELRLGLAPLEESASRLALWTARIQAVQDDAFYRRSLAVDELGTAARLLEWRDALVEAGWDGGAVGSERIDDLAAIEQVASVEPLPPGRADRLVRVEQALAEMPHSPYESLSLLEDVTLWPGLWRRIFERLASLRTVFLRHDVDVPWNATAFDLGLLQARLRGERVSGRVRGDGSLLVLRGDTTIGLAELVAAMLARKERKALVVRSLDPESLDAALERHGLARMGVAGESAWRPATQVLALALELAFEPRDPCRVLELLTLPVGPFRGVLGAKLARAVARQPGVGGHEWCLQKAEAAAHLRAQAAGDARAEAAAEARIARVAAWLERPGSPADGIARADLQAVVERVHGWIHQRIAAGDIAIYATAYARTTALSDAIRHDSRPRFTREDVRQLFDRFARIDEPHELAVEAAGRLAHVVHPSALLAGADEVFFWSFVGGVAPRAKRLPWHNDELAALARRGVMFPDPTASLRSEAEAWRRGVLAAREQVVFVIPSTIKGVATSPHPFWDEVRARLGLDDREVALLTRTVRGVLDASGRRLARVESLKPLALPEGRAAWRLPPEVLTLRGRERKTSVTALERIATCPLAWVLEHVAVLRSGAMSKVASGGLLNGGLAHRLVEVLHHERAFDLDEDSFVARAAVRFDVLVASEGATLLLPGASVERLQLTRQILFGMRALHRYLQQSGFLIAAVEEEIHSPSAVGPLHGRIDLRLADCEGRAAILDLKWGSSAYRELLEQGRAVQLAVYARAVDATHPASWGGAPAAYFALARGTVLATDPRMQAPRTIAGPSLETTLRRVEATASAVLESHAKGVVHVPAASKEVPLLDALAIPEAMRDAHHDAPPTSACGYCDYAAICGRAWRGVA